MGYFTGVCSSYAEIVATLVNVVKNAGIGWEELTDTGGYSVLHKESLYVQVRTIYNGAGVLGRTSRDSGAPINLVGVSDFYATSGAKLGPIQFPVNYFCFTFTNPDEVYFIIKDRDRYQFIAFGQSNVTFTTGTGLWVAGTTGLTSTLPYYIDLADYASYRPHFSTYGYVSSSSDTCAAPFWSYTYSTSSAYNYNNAWLNSDSGWVINSSGARPVGLLLASQPNEFNNQALLLPITYNGGRDATLTNARYIRINYIDPEDILYHGAEQWMVFPFFRKINAWYRVSGDYKYLMDLDSTLTYGWAIRKVS